MYSKQTKIICTIADNKCDPDFLRQLVDNGMNVARLNTAHLSTESAKQILDNIRSVSDRIGVLIDTKGPEVRTCEIEQTIDVQTGDRVAITNTPSKPGDFKVSYDEFVAEIPAGSQILIDDGELELTVDEKTDERLICTVQNDGVIKNKKSLNVPGVHLRLPSLTEKDAEFIDWATKNEIDFIAHSFVRDRDDVMAIKSILDMRKSNIKIIAKIENREGVNNLESILDVAHGVMVARGDLGIEIPAEEVPSIQKKMIRTCIRRIKPVITATQMLHSMIENPRATRAEVSDVANAILDGTDALMLSGETAYGKFPLEAVKTMSNIAHAVESQKEATSKIKHQSTLDKPKLAEINLAKAAATCAAEMPVQAIVTSTRSGGTALLCASFRGQTPIFALSENSETVRELSLSYGVHAAHITVPGTTDELVRVCLSKLLDEGKISDDKLVVFLGGGHIYSHHTNFMQIDTPATLLKIRAH
jgi:pyruvate kinase